MNSFKLAGILLIAATAIISSCTEEEAPTLKTGIPDGVIQVPPINTIIIPVSQNTVLFDGVVSEEEYGTGSFIHLQDPEWDTFMAIALDIEDDGLIIAVECYDPHMINDVPALNQEWAPSDGLTIYIDPRGASWNAVTGDVYKLVSIIDGGFSLQHGQDDGTWSVIYESMGISSKGHVLDERYLYEIFIPYTAIGTDNMASARMTFELRSTDGETIHYTTIPDTDVSMPYTWCALNL